MEECIFQISTGMYEEPFYATGKFEETEELIRYCWKEKHSEKEIESAFEFICDKKTRQSKVIRGGDMSSTMTFDPSESTKGSLNTVYGVIEVDIKTDYINLPSGLAEGLEISYTLDSGSNEPIKNIFSIKKLLQNS